MYFKDSTLTESTFLLLLRFYTDRIIVVVIERFYIIWNLYFLSLRDSVLLESLYLSLCDIALTESL